MTVPGPTGCLRKSCSSNAPHLNQLGKKLMRHRAMCEMSAAAIASSPATPKNASRMRSSVTVHEVPIATSQSPGEHHTVREARARAL